MIMLTSLALLGMSRLAGCIRTVAAQGVLLGLLSLLVREKITAYSCLLAAGIIILKGWAFPVLLRRAIREADVRREVEPFVGYLLSLVWGAAAFAISLWLGSRLLVPYHENSPLAISVALFTILTGFFLIVSRRKALNQILGYLTLENGIYAFGLALAYEVPFLVELAVLLDVFVAVFVMGIMVFHISREFDHIDTDRLSALKD